MDHSAGFAVRLATRVTARGSEEGFAAWAVRDRTDWQKQNVTKAEGSSEVRSYPRHVHVFLGILTYVLKMQSITS